MLDGQYHHRDLNMGHVTRIRQWSAKRTHVIWSFTPMRLTFDCRLMNRVLLLNILSSLSQESLKFRCNYEFNRWDFFYKLYKDFIVNYVSDSSVIKPKPKSTIVPHSSIMINYGDIWSHHCAIRQRALMAIIITIKIGQVKTIESLTTVEMIL